MKVVRAAALARHRAPAFLMLSRLELVQLRKVPPLARCLFVELVGLSDFATGEGSTSYAVLAALLSYDVAPQSHDAGTVTLKPVRTAFLHLVELRLVELNINRNEDERRLFFRVKRRVEIGPSANMRGRVRGRGGKPEFDRASESHNSGSKRYEGQNEGQGIQDLEKDNKSPTPLTDLPPLEKQSRTVIEMRSRLRPQRPRGVIK